MRLCESVQEDIITQFQVVLDKYEEFREEVEEFRGRCTSEKSLKSEGDYLFDFVSEELWTKIKNTKDEILDAYYPIDYADDEEDSDKAGERYRDSKEAREIIFD